MTAPVPAPAPEPEPAPAQPTDVAPAAEGIREAVSERSEAVGGVVDTLDSWALSLGDMRVSVWDGLLVVMVIVGVITAAWFFSKLAHAGLRRITRLDPSQRVLAEKLLTLAVWALAILVGIDLLGIDLTALLPEATGVDAYLLGLVRGLAEVDRRNRYVVFVNREDRGRLPGLPQSFELVTASTRHRPVRLGFQQLALPLLGVARRLDVIHSPSFILPLADSRAKHVLTIHDMTSFSHPALHEPLRRSRLYRTAVAASIRRAARVCVPSRVVGEEIRRLVPEADPARLRVIPYGISEEFRPEAALERAAAAGRLDVPSGYLLYVGTIQPRKNLELLLECYRRLAVTGAVEEQLVLAGRLGWDYDRVVALAGAPGLRGRVHLLGY
ncbi:MAG: glycosyltransferase, partial [Sphingomonadaceae bacterium]|nr:glycosyltransferase [Sphingomonadaceae bacterium]